MTAFCLRSKETVLIFIWNSEVVSICTDIIIVQWLSPFILIKLTRFDLKNEYPEFTNSFNYIQFLPRSQTSWTLQLYMHEEYKWLHIVLSLLWDKQTILTMKSINLSHTYCLVHTWTSRVGEVVQEAMWPTMQLPASSRNTTLSLRAL